jgi:hypothetical protein
VSRNTCVPGHTHEDIDALFAHISAFLGKHGALTVPELKIGIELCRKKPPRVEELDAVSDVWGWISDMPFDKNLMGLTNFRSFELSRTDTGSVFIRGKPNMSDDDDSFCAPIMIIPHLPSPLPRLAYVVPRPLDMDGLSTMTITLSSRLTPVAQAWWQLLLERADDQRRRMCSICFDLKAQESRIVIRQRDSKEVQSQKRGQRNKLAASLEDHKTSHPGCVSLVSNKCWLLSDTTMHSTSLPTTATVVSRPHSSSAPAVNTIQFRMPLQRNGTLATQPQLHLGSAPPGAKGRVAAVNVGYMVAFTCRENQVPFVLAEVVAIGPDFVECEKYRAVGTTFVKTDVNVRLTPDDIIHWNFQLTRRKRTKDGTLTVKDLNIIKWDTRCSGCTNRSSYDDCSTLQRYVCVCVRVYIQASNRLTQRPLLAVQIPLPPRRSVSLLMLHSRLLLRHQGTCPPGSVMLTPKAPLTCASLLKL